jgi:hypothetical protein
MPTQFVRPGRDRVELLDRHGRAAEQVEAGAAHAGSVQPRHLVEAGRGVHDPDGARDVEAEGGDGVERAAIIGAIGRGLDHDRAGDADPAHHRAVFRDAGIGGLRERSRRQWVALVEDMDIGVHGPRPAP